MEGMDLLFGLIGLGCGAYCFFAAYMTKKTGIINSQLLLDPETKNQQCKDTGAFIVETTPKIIVLGIAAVLYGILTLADAYVAEMTSVVLGSIAVFFVVLIWYVRGINKAKKKYF